MTCGTGPLKLVAGVNVNEPSALIVKSPSVSEMLPPVRVDCHCADNELGHRQRVTIDVGVVGFDIAADHRVLVTRGRVVDSDRCVVDRVDRDIQRRRVGQRAIRDGVGHLRYRTPLKFVGRCERERGRRH